MRRKEIKRGGNSTFHEISFFTTLPNCRAMQKSDKIIRFFKVCLYIFYCPLATKNFYISGRNVSIQSIFPSEKIETSSMIFLKKTSVEVKTGLRYDNLATFFPNTSVELLAFPGKIAECARETKFFD